MSTMQRFNFWVGMDVHKDSITIAVFRNHEPEPHRVDRLPNDDRKLRRYLARLEAEGEVRACYEASGAGYVLQRALVDWGIPCELAAPSLIPRRPGEHRKTDRRDAIKIARDFRDHRLMLIHIPSESEERVRDLVRCRETFQREILKSRPYILKFLRHHGFIYREGSHWTTRHMNWIRHVLMPGSLAEEDRVVLGEYLALLEYKLQRRDDLDRRIEELALTPRYKPAWIASVPSAASRPRLRWYWLPSSGTSGALSPLASSWPIWGSCPASPPRATEGGWARSPKPATPASDTFSFRPPGTTEGDPPWDPRSPSAKRDRIRQSSLTPGSANTGSTSSTTDSLRRSPSRSLPPPSHERWSDSSGPSSETSILSTSSTRR